jgi:hypothetical protein
LTAGAGDLQGRRCAGGSARDGPRGAEYRQRARGAAGHIPRREREAVPGGRRLRRGTRPSAGLRLRARFDSGAGAMRARQFRAPRPLAISETREQTRQRGRSVMRGDHAWRRAEQGDLDVCTSEKPAGATAVRPFRVEIPQPEIEELRRAGLTGRRLMTDPRERRSRSSRHSSGTGAPSMTGGSSRRS